jgi:hypothetical protein
MKKLIALTLGLCIACFAASPALAVPAPMVPTIHSTVGTGPKGCVRYTKFVGFSFTSGNYLPSSARVSLDGVPIGERTYALPARRPQAAAVAPAHLGFSWVINLHGLRPGIHQLKLTVSGSLLLGYAPTAADFSTTKKIVNCS